MKLHSKLAALGLLTCSLAAPSLHAGAFGNDNMVGKHFQVNLIGVPQDKIADMQDTSRRAIFVPLDSGEDVGRKVKIKYVAGDSFLVVDGNATDDNTAIIQVPHEYCDDYTGGCDDLVAFDVYAIALGKPYGGALVSAECNYTLKVVDGDGTEGLTCEDTLLMGSFELTRSKGKPKVEDITDIFRAEGCLDVAEDDGSFSGTCESGDIEFRNLWIFNIEELADYMWNYDNNGLKLMQVRFYPSIYKGYIGTVQ